MSKTLGFALGAGGSRGVAHIGFLKAMEEAGIKAQFVTGCSMGAIVGACYCAGVSADEMKDTVLSLSLTDIATVNLTPFRKNGLMRLTKGRNMLAGLMGEPQFSELEIPFACVATDLIDGKTVCLDEGSVVDAAIASSSIPGAIVPAKFGKYEMLCDGCILERVPTKELKKMGAEVIVAVDVLGDLAQNRDPSGSLMNTLLRVIDVMDTKNTMNKRRARMRYVDLFLEPDLGEMDQNS